MINYSTSISLSPEDNNRFQGVYASQRYGTFFGLFAKFTVTKEEDHTFLHKIDLEIINYKGILNIGLNKYEIDGDAIEKNRNIPTILLKIEVQAKTGEENNKGSINFETPLLIKKGMYFSVISELIPLSGNFNKQPYFDGIFDNEFYYRDGLVNEERIVTEIPLDKNSQSNEELGYDFQSILLPQIKFGSIRCRAGNSKIVTP